MIFLWEIPSLKAKNFNLYFVTVNLLLDKVVLQVAMG